MSDRQPMFSSYLAGIGVALIIVIAGAASVVEISRPFRRIPVPDAVTIEQGRLEFAKRVLPARGAIGYLSDQNPRREGEGEYFITEYSLAPLQVSRDPDREIVLGNFSNWQAALVLIRQYRLHIVRDIGGGLMVLGRDSQ